MQRIAISRELAHLIAAALKPSGHQPFDVIGEQIDPQKFAALVKWHQIRPLAFEYIQEKGIALPERLVQQLREFTLGQAVTNMAFLGICVRIYSRLEAQNVKVFPMKGALWAWMLYDKPTLREFGDIDYFIGKSDVSASLQVLSEEGFAADDYRHYLLNQKSVATDYLDTDYQLPLTPLREHTLQSLEIQWNCTYPRYCYHFTFDELMIHPIEFVMGGKPVVVPNMETQLLMMVIHHAGVEQWDKLKYMADFVRLLDNAAHELNWQYINDVTSARGFRNLLLESLGVAGYITGRDYLHLAGETSGYPSEAFLKEILMHWENERPSPKTKTWRIFLYNIKNRDRWSDRLSIVAAHLGYLTHWKLLWHKWAWYRRRSLNQADGNRSINTVSGGKNV